jgi:class 3 adenylate cyclase
MARALRAWAAILQTAGRDHAAIALKLLGDGCLSAFEDPVNALAFVTAIRKALAASRLEIRAGIEAGRVEVADDEIIGEAVLTAADLCRRAAPGQTLITPSLRHLAGSLATRESLTVVV